jgi:hypothetical protein
MFARGVSKRLLTIAVAALIALGLAACGGGGDTTQSTAQATSGGGSNQGGSSEQGEGADSFKVPGGDNSIQNYGEEADESEIEAVETALNGFLDARAEGNWAKSCSYLAKATLKPLETLSEKTPKLKGASCAKILAALESRVPAPERANPLTHGIASVRIKGPRGFALFHGANGSDYFMLMTNEGGEWKVSALLPSEFPSSAAG